MAASMPSPPSPSSLSDNSMTSAAATAGASSVFSASDLAAGLKVAIKEKKIGLEFWLEKPLSFA